MKNADDTGNPALLGLRWARTLWGLEPRWSVDPDITVIMKTVKSTLNIRSASSIEFLGRCFQQALCRQICRE
ncbi:hypothetical protein LZ30DRAFT_696627 [Colletotrichum cereale]|nr:hypothetical protein LZ30DRAFT_696627 [Colletotrichum cereale]